MTHSSDIAGLKELGQRTDAELEALFGNMYSGWERGVNVTQERFGHGDTQFTETPMTDLELAARFVAAEVGVNIYEITGRAAFAPIIVFLQIRARLGPLFDSLSARVKELEANGRKLAETIRDMHEAGLALRQERDEAYERAAKAARQIAINAERRAANHTPQSQAEEAALNKAQGAFDAEAAIRRLASGPEGGSVKMEGSND